MQSAHDVHLRAARSDGFLATDHCDVFANSGGDWENCAPSPTDISCDPGFCDPENLDAREQLFQILMAEGSPDDVRKEGTVLAACYLEGKNSDKAVKTFGRIITKGYGSPDIFRGLIHARISMKTTHSLFRPL